MNKIVVVGAGKTGRGFVGRLLAEGGREIIFIDRDKSLIDEMNRVKSYNVFFFADKRPPVTVCRYRACTWEDADIDGADTVFVSVGGTNLADVGARLKGLLKKDRGYSVISCENAANPSAVLQNAYGDCINAGFSNGIIFCTTIEKSGLDILSEDYPYLQCEGAPLRDNYTSIEGIRPIDNFDNFLTRKIYTYNSASAVIAYLGWKKGYTVYADAANDVEISALLDTHYEQAGAALCKAFGYDEADQAEFAGLSKAKFLDRAIVDTIERNAREPLRKLGPDERVVGPMKLIEQYGGDSGVLQMTAAAILLYADENDAAWTRIKKEKTHSQILEEVCGLESGGKLEQGILGYVRQLEKC